MSIVRSYCRLSREKTVTVVEKHELMIDERAQIVLLHSEGATWNEIAKIIINRDTHFKPE